MTKLKKYNTLSDWDTAKSGLEYPSAGLIKEDRSIVYLPPPAKAGDIAYWDGFKILTTPISSYSFELGQAVGVVVVPQGFATDGKIRIAALNSSDVDGNASESDVKHRWYTSRYTNSGLTDFSYVTITDNTGNTSSGSNSYGRLPSDSFTGATSFVDPNAKYGTTEYLIPSPYLGDTPNPAYYNDWNALSDFNGLNNTSYLVNTGANYYAAKACWNYNDGVANIQWYLPSIGELGYVIPRLKAINNSLVSLGKLEFNGIYWSSTENSASSAYSINTGGSVSPDIKDMSSNKVRPFAII